MDYFDWFFIIASLASTVYALQHCIKNPLLKKKSKWLYGFLIVFVPFGGAGAVCYFCLECDLLSARRRRNRYKRIIRKEK